MIVERRSRVSNVVFLHGRPAPVAHFLRIGHSGHKRLDQFLAAGQLPYQRFVANAGTFQRQRELIGTLRQAGKELILDTNVAELSVVGRWQGAAQGAPWANERGVLTEAQLRPVRNDSDVIGKIARFVLEHGIKRVLAPAHLLLDATDPWFQLDLRTSEALRVLLDREGGPDVAIDYPLIISNAALNDVAQRRVFVAALAGLLIDSVWLRISGFGGETTAAALRKYISAARDFHALNKPVISDCVGGLSGLAILAFGAAGGIAHGVAEKERFDTSDWHKPPPPPDPDRKRGSNTYAVLLQGIDRLLKPEQAELLVGAPGGRRLVSCQDRSCCPNGFDDTMRDPKGHYLRQRALKCEALSQVPEPLRAQDYLNNTLSAAARTARQIARLRIEDPALKKATKKNADRLERVRLALENLKDTEAVETRSSAFPPPMPLHQSNSGAER